MLGTTFSLLLLATPGAADGLALSAVSGLVPSGALPMTVLSALASDRLRTLPTDGEGSSKQPHEVSPKLALRGKEKGCCGYPLGEPGTYKLTYYWLAYESEYANEPYEIEIYTRQGFPIGRFPRAYVFELRLEGSGVLRDGRLINYDGRCAYGIGTCYQTLDPQAHPFGKGGQQRALTPFRSVAVDPRWVPLGTPLYLPELRGMRLPDGSSHDGCVRADDTGGGIRRREIDFFVESYANYKALEEQLLNDHRVTPLVEEPRCTYLRLFDPGVDRRSESIDETAVSFFKKPPPRPPSIKKSGSQSKPSRRSTHHARHLSPQPADASTRKKRA
ncbi:MAG: hypothetical protein JNM83_09545 [Myxococcales bacterium]|nr:hypothetical protein [Myxococcales bacterium]